MGRWAISAAAALLVLVGPAAAGPKAFVISIAKKAPPAFAELPAVQIEFAARDAKSGETTFATLVRVCPKDSDALCSALSFPQLKTTLRVLHTDLAALRGYFQKRSEESEPAKTDCEVVARDEQQQKTAGFTLVDCFPVAFRATLDAEPSEVTTETITIAVERVEEA